MYLEQQFLKEQVVTGHESLLDEEDRFIYVYTLLGIAFVERTIQEFLEGFQLDELTWEENCFRNRAITLWVYHKYCIQATAPQHALAVEVMGGLVYLA